MSVPTPSDWRRVSKVTRQIERAGTTHVPRKSRYRPSGGGGKKDWFWSKLTSSTRIYSPSDSRYGKYSHIEMEYDEEQMKLVEKEDGITGSYEDDQGYAREIEWNSPYCLEGHVVKMYKQKDFYVFQYTPNSVYGCLNTNNVISAGANDPSNPTNQVMGYGDVIMCFHANSAGATAPYPPFEQNKYAGESTTMRVFNTTSSTIPPFNRTSHEPMWIRCVWEWGRWQVALPVECVV